MLGLHTVADLDAIDARTLGLCGAGAPNAAVQIELARARVGASPAYRKRGVDAVTVPRGDIEVDVDMENTNDGCYLWGVLVTDRRPARACRSLPGLRLVGPRHRGSRPQPPSSRSGRWLTEERARAAAEGATFRAYCYSNAEQVQMRRVADRIGRHRRDEVDEFMASDQWVDLLEVVKAQLITGRSMGLKETAPLAGFSWRAGDGGGTLAMVKYDQAMDEESGPGGACGGAGVDPRVQRGRRAGDRRAARVARRAGSGSSVH